MTPRSRLSPLAANRLADDPLLYTTLKSHVKKGHSNTDGANNVLSPLSGSCDPTLTPARLRCTSARARSAWRWTTATQATRSATSGPTAQMVRQPAHVAVVGAGLGPHTPFLPSLSFPLALFSLFLSLSLSLSLFFSLSLCLSFSLSLLVHHHHHHHHHRTTTTTTRCYNSITGFAAVCVDWRAHDPWLPRRPGHGNTCKDNTYVITSAPASTHPHASAHLSPQRRTGPPMTHYSIIP